MKLFSKYSRIHLIATIMVFLPSSVAYYFVLRFILVGQADEDLKFEQHEIEKYTAKYKLHWIAQDCFAALPKPGWQWKVQDLD